jgi:hypothetical protein
MLDPAQRNDVPAATVGGTDPAATIEQLLLSGLEHYVEGRCESAVDVWTRVLFLDRNHAGARAHIRRARATMAERLRESEALLHAGVEACDRGEPAEARVLLTKAIQRGGANDEVLAVLERVERLGAVPAYASAPGLRSRHRRQHARRDMDPVAAPRPGRISIRWFVALGVIVAIAALYAAAAWAPLDLGRGGSRLLSGAPTSTGAAAPLPVPSVSALAVEQAEALAREGRLTEALGVLAAVGRGGGLHQEVEALRGRLQRRVLEGLEEAEGRTPRVGDVTPARRQAP